MMCTFISDSIVETTRPAAQIDQESFINELDLRLETRFESIDGLVLLECSTL